MRNIFKFVRTEFRMQIYTPVYWLIILVFLIQTGILYCETMDHLVKSKLMKYDLNNITFLLFSSPSSGLFVKMQSYMYLYIPLLTMGIFSRELSSGSIKLLYSSPVSNGLIVFTKFLSLVLVGGTLIFILCIYAGITICITNIPDTGAIIAGLLGLFLLLLAYISIGMFMSSITSYGVVAALGTLIVFSILNYVGNLWQDMPVVQDILYWLNLSGRANAFVNGMITTEDVLYFILVTAMFLSFTYFKLNAHTSNESSFKRVFNYVVVFVMVGFTGYLSSLPASKKYYDLTADNRNTLSTESRQILSKVENKLTIHTYVNMFYQHFQVLPISYKLDQKRLEQYVRFKPEISMKYHYYRKLTDNSPLRNKYPDLSESELYDTLKMINEWDVPLHPLEEMPHSDILKNEDYRFVRVLEYENGSTALLRTYRDLMRIPFEVENSSAFKSLMEGAFNIGVFQGNGERSLYSDRKDDIKILFSEPTNRSSLVNLGFNTVELNPNRKIPDSVELLILAGPSIPYSDTVFKNIGAFYARGGNIAIMAEPESASWINPWLEQFSVRMDPLALTHQHLKLEKEELLVFPVSDSGEVAPFYDQLINYKSGVVTPHTSAIQIGNSQTYAVKPLLGFKNSNGEYFPNAVRISGKGDGKHGKIVLMTDVDWMCNEELFKQRQDVSTSNYLFAKSIFYWLSDGKYPVNITRDKPLDTELLISSRIWKPIQVLLLYILPGLIIAFSALLLYKRSRV